MTSSCTQARKQAAQSRIFSLFALASRSPAIKSAACETYGPLADSSKAAAKPLAELTDP